ncbi:MAG: hypothetical protein FJ304_09435 [Planctomycetes bacterium]|nr:hypothetical protein [Planctomycetota bacterium]
MRRAARPLAVALFAVAVVGLLSAPDARAQNRKNNDIDPAPQPLLIPGGGTELFRAFLDREGVQPVRANNLWAGDDLIVVVIGNPAGQGWGPNPLQWARNAVGVGGAALIATDQGCTLYQNGNEFNPVTSINWNAVGNLSTDPADCYQPGDGIRHHDTPFAVPVSPDDHVPNGEKPGRVWAVFRGLTKLATNQPAYFVEPREFRGEYRYPLARLPKSTLLNGFQQLNPAPLLAIGGDGEPAWGRAPSAFLAVADSSVYINQMVMEPGTDNLELTLRTIEYLQGPDKKRKRCLFFENGRVIESFDGLRGALTKPRPPIPPDKVPNIGPLFGKHQDKLVKFLDEKADELQNRDFVHNAFVGPKNSTRERRNFADWMDVACVLLAIVTCSFLLRRSWNARQPLDVPPPPNTGAGAASTGPPGVFDRRQKELVRRNNLYEPVRNLMREFFDGAGAPPNPGPKIPKISIDRSIRKPDSLRQAIRDMWRIAYGPPMAISAQRWFELEPYFERLRRAHADGKWRFQTAAAAVA